MKPIALGKVSGIAYTDSGVPLASTKLQVRDDQDVSRLYASATALTPTSTKGEWVTDSAGAYSFWVRSDRPVTVIAKDAQGNAVFSDQGSQPGESPYAPGSANTLAALSDATTFNLPVLNAPLQAALAAKAPASGIAKTALSSSVQTSLSLADSSLQPSSIGAANGVAGLDASSRLPVSQLPVGTVVPVVNDLTTGGVASALSAQQGVVIKAVTDNLSLHKVSTNSLGTAVNFSEGTSTFTLTGTLTGGGTLTKDIVPSVDLTSNQTIGGTKTFTAAPVFGQGLTANIIPRTDTISNLLLQGDTTGEMASATDDPAIVQFSSVGPLIYEADTLVYPTIATAGTTPVSITIKPVAKNVVLTRTTGTGTVTITIAPPVVTTMAGRRIRFYINRTSNAGVFLIGGYAFTVRQWAEFQWDGASAWSLVDSRAGYQNSTIPSLAAPGSQLYGFGMNYGTMSQNLGAGVIYGSGSVALGGSSVIYGNRSVTLTASTTVVNTYGNNAAAINAGTAYGNGSVVIGGSSTTLGSTTGTSITDTGVVSFVSTTGGIYNNYSMTVTDMTKFAVGDTVQFSTTGAGPTYSSTVDAVAAGAITFKLTILSVNLLAPSISTSSYPDGVLACTNVRNLSVATNSMALMGATALNTRSIAMFGTPDTAGNLLQRDSAIFVNKTTNSTANLELFIDGATAFNGRTAIARSNRFCFDTAKNASYLMTVRFVGRGLANGATPAFGRATYQVLIDCTATVLSIIGTPTVMSALVNNGLSSTPGFTFAVSGNQLVVNVTGSSASDVVTWVGYADFDRVY